jgi:hypothetical protein
MDDAQVEALRRWAVGLSTDGRPELKAAAKAILLLCDDLEAERSQLLEERLIRDALEAREAAEGASEGLQSDLLRRLRSFLERLPSRR